MGYRHAIEATGTKVNDFKEFGDWQGTWVAILEDGRVIEGSYGSCSGCDAFQAEFDYSEPTKDSDGTYYNASYDEITKEEYDILLAKHEERLRAFGQSYINDAQTFDVILGRYQKKIDDEYAWQDDKEIYEWLKSKVICV